MKVPSIMRIYGRGHYPQKIDGRYLGRRPLSLQFGDKHFGNWELGFGGQGLGGQALEGRVRFSLSFVKLIQKECGILAGVGLKGRGGEGDNKMRKAGKEKKSYTMYNETLYEVERVVQIKWVKNRQYCYIKWKGYDERFNTWEPKEHITFCYNYVAPDDKDDDPEYRDAALRTPPNTKHQYHTRGKIRPKHSFKALCETDEKEKEDHTHLEDAEEPMQSHRSWKPFCERNVANELDLKELKDRKEKEQLAEQVKDQLKEQKEISEPTFKAPKFARRELEDEEKGKSRSTEEEKEKDREKGKEKENGKCRGTEEEKKPQGTEEGKGSWKVARDSLISRILWLNCEEANEKRIGKVEMEDGKIAYMYEDILKARYPEKVIEYYEQEMRQQRIHKGE